LYFRVELFRALDVPQYLGPVEQDTLQVNCYTFCCEAERTKKKNVYDTANKGEMVDGQFPSLLAPAAHM
jgi:hypothetical protein